MGDTLNNLKHKNKIIDFYLWRDRQKDQMDQTAQVALNDSRPLEATPSHFEVIDYATEE